MSHKRILVAEDDLLFREYVQEVLAPKGYMVDTVPDGQQAVERMMRATYDLVLSDVQMPHADGLEVLEQTRRLQPSARVILMSASRSGNVLAAATRRGACDFLEKPFTPKTLEVAVERALECSATQDRRPELAR